MRLSGVAALGVVLATVVVAAAPAHAGASFSGKVIDAETGAGIPGALVAADDGTAESAADGSFALTVTPAGRRARPVKPVSVFVFAPGYAPTTAELRVKVPVRIALHRDARAVELIEISARMPDTGSPPSYAVSREAVRALPGSGNDVLRSLQSQPGVGRNVYGLGGLVLRGASPHESSIYLDGIEVPLAYHFGGVTSFYPSALLDDISLNPGSADVEHGRGIGGVVELRGRKARTDRYRFGSEVGVFDASVFGEGPAGDGGLMIGLRRSYADAFIGQLLPEDRQVLPRYYDGQLRYDTDVGEGSLSLFGFFSDDHVVSWGGTSFDQGFARIGARYERPLDDHTTLTLTPWTGWGSTRVVYVFEHTETRPDLEQYLVLERRPLGVKGDVRHDTRWGHIAGGVDVQGANVRFKRSADLLEGSSTHLNDMGDYFDAGAWLEARWRLAGGRLTLKPGLRADYLGTAAVSVLEPRIAVTQELSETVTLRTTMGLHHQPPGPVAAVADGDDPIDELDLAEAKGKVVQGIHTSVGARVQLPESIVASLTAYHVRRKGPADEDMTDVMGGDPMKGMLPLPLDLGPALQNVVGEEFYGVRADTRRGAGLELSAQRRTERWLLWMSYTLSAVQTRPTAPSRHSWTTMDLDQTHNLNLVASVSLGAWQLGARFRYTTGFPFTPYSLGFDPDNGQPELVRGDINSQRLADFKSLDLRVDRAWRRRWGQIGVFLDVQNVTNAHNEEGIKYELDFPEARASRQPGLPILPLIGVAYQPPD